MTRTQQIIITIVLTLTCIVLPTILVIGAAISFEKSIETNETGCVNCTHCIKAQLDYLDRLQYLHANRGKPVLNGAYWELLKSNRARYQQKLDNCPKLSREWGIIDRNFKCKTCSTDRAIFRTVSESTDKCELDTSVSAAVYGWK